MVLDTTNIIFALIGILITIVGWFISQTMKQINTSQREMFNKLDKLSEKTLVIDNRLTVIEAHTEYCRGLRKEIS